jgi:3-isopropylmalate/(R)-2-methylmalate dehydratase small subunit
MPFHFALIRETRPEVLRDHVMEGIDPEFPKKVSPGDIIVAGKRFAQGNPHIYGLIGIHALGLGLVVESIPRGSYRNAINAGLPFLPSCPGVTREADQGDELEVDFKKGLFVNMTRGTRRQYAPLDATLLEIIEAGGWELKLQQRIARQCKP